MERANNVNIDILSKSNLNFTATDPILKERTGIIDIVSPANSNLDFIVGEPRLVKGKGDSQTEYKFLHLLQMYEVEEHIEVSHNGKSLEPRNVKRTVNGSIYMSNMTTFEVELYGSHDLTNEEINIRRGLSHPDFDNNTVQWIDYGNFIVQSSEFDTLEEVTTLQSSDYMIKAQTPYVKEDVALSFPKTVGQVFNKIIQVLGLTTSTPTFRNSDIVLQVDHWANTSYTYRDVFNHIAELTSSVISIRDNKVEVYEPIETNVELDINKMKLIEFLEDYKKPNIVNVTQEPQHDNNPYPEDWASIPKDERQELVFANNPILDSNPLFYAEKLYNQVKDLEYKQATSETFGYGVFEVGDIVSLPDPQTNERIKTIVSFEETNLGGFPNSEQKFLAPIQTQDEYVVETDERRALQETYILVDKANGEIVLANEKIDELEDSTSKIIIDVDGIKNEVSKINTNSNLIINLSGTMDTYDYWTWENTPLLLNYKGLKQRKNLSANTNFEIVELSNTLARYGLSFHSVGTAVTDYGFVIPDTVYSFRGKRVSGTQSFTIDVREFDKDKELIKTTPKVLVGNEYEAFTFTPDSNTMYVKLAFKVTNVSYENRLVLSDMMFNRGNPKEWQETAAEVKHWAQSQITQLDNQILSTVEEIKTVDGKTEENKSEIDQLANRIVLAVNNQGELVQVELGIDPETGSEFIVKANNISLEGIVTANEYFKILLDGSASMTNAYVNGEIVAVKGKIGNYTITQGSLVGNDVTLGNRLIKVGPATLERATVGNEEALAIRSYFLELGDSSKQANWVQIGGRKFVQGFPKDGFGVFARNIMPDESTTYAKEIGSSSNRWDNIYLKNQPNVSSDLRYKNLITAISDDLLDVVKDIKPKQYYTIYDDKVHFGYIAQDVERALYKHAYRLYGREKAHQVVDDFAMLSKDESYMSLLYGEIQVLKDAYYQRELSKQEEINKSLQSQIDELKEMIENGL